MKSPLLFPLPVLLFAVAAFVACERPAVPTDELLPTDSGLTYRLRLPTAERTLVALTYDDALYTQRTVALPALRRYCLPATFFLNAVDNRLAVLDWREAALAGHELANHSLWHPCTADIGWPEFLSTEAYDPQRFLAELATQHALIGHIDGKPDDARTYAHPCNDHFIGSEPRISTLPLLADSPLVRYGRSGSSEPSSSIRPGEAYDPMALPSWTVPERSTGAELIAFAEQAHDEGGAAVYTFHGIGGDWIVLGEDEHEELLDYLMTHSDRFEVVTFGELAARMVE